MDQLPPQSPLSFMRLPRIARFSLWVAILVVAGIVIAISTSLGQEALRTVGISFSIGLLLAVGVGAYIRKPEWLLWLIGPSIIFPPVLTVDLLGSRYEITPTELLIAFLSVAVIIDWLVMKGRRFAFGKIWAWLVGFIALDLLSILWAEERLSTIIEVRMLVFHLAAMTCVLLLSQRALSLTHYIKGILVSFSVTALLVSGQLLYRLWELGSFSSLSLPGRESISTPIGPYVFISAVFVLLVPSLFLWFARARRTRQPLWLAVIIGSALPMLSVIGKAEIMGALLGVILQFRDRAKRLIIILGLFILVVGATLYVPLGGFTRFLGERFATATTDPATQFRINELRAAKDIFFEHPLIGVGGGNLKMEYSRRLPERYRNEATNVFVQVFTQLGIAVLPFIIGIGIGLWKVLTVLFGKFRTEVSIALGTMIILGLFNGQFEVTIFGFRYGLLWWMIIALGMLWAHAQQDAKKSLQS